MTTHSNLCLLVVQQLILCFPAIALCLLGLLDIEALRETSGKPTRRTFGKLEVPGFAMSVSGKSFMICSLSHRT